MTAPQTPKTKNIVLVELLMMMLQGGLTQEEDKKLQDHNAVPSAAFAVFSGFGSFVGWFGLGIGSSFPLLMIFDNVIRLAVLNRVKQGTFS